jgi:hypothetical protein
VDFSSDETVVDWGRLSLDDAMVGEDRRNCVSGRRKTVHRRATMLKGRDATKRVCQPVFCVMTPAMMETIEGVQVSVATMKAVRRPRSWRYSISPTDDSDKLSQAVVPRPWITRPAIRVL